MNTLIDSVFDRTLQYIEGMPKSVRKEIGQFFTSVETAKYMASMFSLPHKRCLSVLDAGAGSGILTAAVVDRLQNESIDHIEVTCYETGRDVLPILKTNLESLESNSRIPLKYNIIESNYITTQSADFNETLFANPQPRKYDWIIGNPPYKKISKDAEEAVSMPTVCHGAPNLYFLFMAMGLFNLDSNGEMVYIIPRSWMSGAYFKSFRDYLLQKGSLRHIHLFGSRDKVFDKESVLQETVIVKLDKSGAKSSVTITSSQANGDFHNVRAMQVPYENIVSGAENYVYVATSETELKTLSVLGRWQNTLPSIGLKMKTGLVVDFRCREFLRNEPGKDIVPLFYSQHIKDGRVVFPIRKEDEYVTTEKRGFVQRNRNYLLVKRFTAKEESRRLQCGIYLASDLPGYKYVSTQNKVNFIDGLADGMPAELVYGLYVLFNSTIYDSYYRILNGSTQVNSSEVNAMPVPSIGDILAMGRSLMAAGDLSVEMCDKILEVAL